LRERSTARTASSRPSASLDLSLLDLGIGWDRSKLSGDGEQNRADVATANPERKLRSRWFKSAGSRNACKTNWTGQQVSHPTPPQNARNYQTRDRSAYWLDTKETMHQRRTP